jgi:hypothetical protein
MPRADNLDTSCADCLAILGASASRSPKALSRPVEGWLYLRVTENNLLLQTYSQFVISNYHPLSFDTV